MPDVLQNDLQMRRLAAIRTAHRDLTGLTLRKRRQWFAEGETPADKSAGGAGAADKTGTSTVTSSDTSDETKNTDKSEDGDDKGDGKKQPPGPVPYDEFKKANAARRAAEARLAELEKAQKDREAAEAEKQRQDAEKRGEFEQLYQAEQEKVKTLTTERDELLSYRKLFEAQVAKQREGLPEHIQELMAGMTPLQQAEYLQKHGDKLKANPAPHLDGGERGSGTGKTGVKLNPLRG